MLATSGDATAWFSIPSPANAHCTSGMKLSGGAFIVQSPTALPSSCTLHWSTTPPVSPVVPVPKPTSSLVSPPLDDALADDDDDADVVVASELAVIPIVPPSPVVGVAPVDPGPPDVGPGVVDVEPWLSVPVIEVLSPHAASRSGSA